MTPAEQTKAEILDRFGLTEEDPHKHSYKRGDPRSFARNEAHVPDWGNVHLLNQPKSRADSFVSNSILDYSRPDDHAPRAQKRSANNKKVSALNKPNTRPGSHERIDDFSAWSVEQAVQGNNGLTNAIRAFSDEDENHVFWVGTLGCPTDALSDRKKEEIHERLENEYDALVTYVNDKDFSGHYDHYCKVMLWPVFHYQIPDHPKSKAYEDDSWRFYKTVNQAFADKVVAGYKNGDIIWIHDYHLLLVPDMIRKKLPDAQIGFFLHTAFPSSEVFRCLSTRRDLLLGMLGANLVAFQTREYAQHFLQTCSRILVVEATVEGVQLEDRFVNVTSQPIGIEPAALKQVRKEPDVAELIQDIRERYPGKRLIVARDKLDHVSGVRQKLLAFELFLSKYPKWRENVVLIQIATSTTENGELLATVADITTRIDARFSTLAHQPVLFLMQDLSYSQYVALLSVADALMITSLREGMGLTAQEFIFYQDGLLPTFKRHGPVILSEFTGTAAVFGGQEISINPWDYQQCAKAIKQALEMSEAEKVQRYTKLRQLVLHYTGGYWIKQLEKALRKCYDEQTQRNALSIPRLSHSILADKYKSSKRRLFLLDLEGTLASYGPDRNIFTTSHKPMLEMLNELCADRKNAVYVMSARMQDELTRLFYQVPSVGLIAEDGCFLREPHSAENDWITFSNVKQTRVWKEDTRKVLDYYANRIDGSRIEERKCSLVLDYSRAEDPQGARAQAGDCINHINDSCDAELIQAVPVGKTVIIHSRDHSKDSAAERVLDRLTHGKHTVGKGMPAPDFLMVAGDDREDEAVFRWANELDQSATIKNVTTVSMSKRNTEAQSTLTQGPAGTFSLIPSFQQLDQLT